MDLIARLRMISNGKLRHPPLFNQLTIVDRQTEHADVISVNDTVTKAIHLYTNRKSVNRPAASSALEPGTDLPGGYHPSIP